jgi:hypothetical protein
MPRAGSAWCPGGRTERERTAPPVDRRLERDQRRAGARAAPSYEPASTVVSPVISR